MIKRFLIFCFLIFVTNALKAQKYGNEWIDYSQDYYKIKISKEGIYRIPDSILLNAGIPLNSIDPRNFQLFHNGTEQAIYIEGENDGVFDSNDFIEFYGNKNDGFIDSLLYEDVEFVPNPYYSLINDTAVYFLTWNSSTSNKRMSVETDVSFSFYAASTYFLKDEVKSYNSDYYAGETNAAGGTNCRYTSSEGYFDRVININNNLVYSLNTPNVYSLGPNVAAEIVFVGASKDKDLINQGKDDHHITVGYKKSTASSYSNLSDTTFQGYAACKIEYSLYSFASVSSDL